MVHVNGIPVFGERVPGKQYLVRACVYALIKNDRECVAVVETPLGIFLPGGGIEEDETPEMAVCREALEECGLQIKPGHRIAEAIQLVHSKAEQAHFEKRSVFLNATIVGPGPSASEIDHRLLWLAAESAPERMAHESHAWVIHRHTDSTAGPCSGYPRPTPIDR